MNSQSRIPVRPHLCPLGDASGVAGSAVPGQEEAREDKRAAEVDESEVVNEDEVAARNPRVARRPDAPTKAMVLTHELHHADY